MKLTKTGSEHLSTALSSLDPGRLFFPLVLVMHRGTPLESEVSEYTGLLSLLPLLSLLFCYHCYYVFIVILVLVESIVIITTSIIVIFFDTRS